MGTQGGFQVEIHGFLKFTDPVPGRQGDTLQLAGFGRIRPEVTVAFFMVGKRWRTATQIDKHIALTMGGSFDLAIPERATARGIQGLKLGKLQFEIAQCAIGARQPTPGKVVTGGGQLYRPRIIDDTGNAQFVLYQLGHSDGLLGGADNATHPAGLNRFHRCHRSRYLSGGKQGRLLGVQAPGLCAGRTPASAIPDVDGTQRSGLAGFSLYVLAQTLEQSSLLAAGDKQLMTAAQVLGRRLHVGAAQLIHHDHLLGCRGRSQYLRIKRLGLVAGTYQ